MKIRFALPVVVYNSSKLDVKIDFIPLPLKKYSKIHIPRILTITIYIKGRACEYSLSKKHNEVRRSCRMSLLFNSAGTHEKLLEYFSVEMTVSFQ